MFRMESSRHPIQLPNILSEDYQHFEASHEQYPAEAEQVFSRVTELRNALQAFREATAVAVRGIKEEGGGDCGLPALEAVEPEVQGPALLPSAEGSMEQAEEEGGVLLARSGDAIEVAG
jgi:hypothetical protein